MNRIYTKAGDDGTTTLGDGTRLSKTHPRIKAFGAVDELNAYLGAILAAGLPEPQAAQLRHIQNDLFDIGADLCVPETDEPPAVPPLRVVAEQVVRLEQWIDAYVEQLEPLSSFVLPGGTPAAAHLHVARTICRRTEIETLQLAEFEEVNPQVTMYLNRLSDLLFVMARLANEAGRGDVLWVPGQGRHEPPAA